MHRRTFLRTASAATILPVLPLSATTVPATAAPAAAAQLKWATLMARSHATASPALIQSWLGVGPAQAQAVMSGLVESGVVGAPVAGTAAAVQPMFPRRTIPGLRTARDKIADLAEKAVRDVLEDPAPPSEQAGDIEPTPPEPV